MDQIVVREVANARDALQVSKCSKFSKFMIWNNGEYLVIPVDEIWKWARSKGEKEVRKRLGSMKLLVELSMPWRR